MAHRDWQGTSVRCCSLLAAHTWQVSRQDLARFFPGVPVEDQAQIIAWWSGLVGEGNIRYLGYKEQAIYGEASYRLSDQWEIQLGLRVAEVDHQTDISRPGIESKVDPIFHLVKPSDIVSPKFALTWRPIEGWMVYATYSEGFRPGIINSVLVTKLGQLQGAIDDPDTPEATRAVSQEQIDRTSGFSTAESDYVENTELGIKASVLDGRLSFTGSYYSISYKDYVLRIRDRFPRGLPGRRNLQYGINAGTAESRGLDRAILKLSRSEVSCIGVLPDWRPTFSVVFFVFFSGFASRLGTGRYPDSRAGVGYRGRRRARMSPTTL